MTKLSAQFRQICSLMAGFLIGASIVVATFAAADADSGTVQSGLVFGAAVILALGIALQVVVTSKPRSRVATGDPGISAPANRRRWVSRVPSTR
jgi:hypothetical protein